MNTISTRLYLPKSGLAAWDTNNQPVRGIFPAAYWHVGPLGATLIFGAAGEFQRFVLSSIILMQGSTSAPANIALTDSNDPGALANKRTYQFSTYMGGTIRAVCSQVDVKIPFFEGVVLTITDAAAAGQQAAVLLHFNDLQTTV